MSDEDEKHLKEYIDKTLPEYPKSMECSECMENVIYWGQWITKFENDKAYLICQNCYSDDSIVRILEDEESMNALKLLKTKGYSIDKIIMMLEKHDFV